MKNSNKNKQLFWYGWKANLKRGLGIFLLIIGIITFAIQWIVALLCIAGAIYLLAKGASQRFDYKMQSGTMVHKGDW